MRSSETTTLPGAVPEYDVHNEQVMRRVIEHALLDLRTDIIDSRDMTDKSSSLSQRRMQFLLMGA